MLTGSPTSKTSAAATGSATRRRSDASSESGAEYATTPSVASARPAGTATTPSGPTSPHAKPSAATHCDAKLGFVSYSTTNESIVEPPSLTGPSQPTRIAWSLTWRARAFSGSRGAVTAGCSGDARRTDAASPAPTDEYAETRTWYLVGNGAPPPLSLSSTNVGRGRGGYELPDDTPVLRIAEYVRRPTASWATPFRFSTAYAPVDARIGGTSPRADPKATVTFCPSHGSQLTLRPL